MNDHPKAIRSRGVFENPTNRFEQIRIERDPDNPQDFDIKPGTRYFNDTSKSFNKLPRSNAARNSLD